MPSLLNQPSTIPTAFALLMLGAIVQVVRASSRPGAGQRPLRSRQKVAALAFGVLAVLAGAFATMIDAEWFGHDPYRFAVLPATCMVLGCGIGTLAALHSSNPPPGHSNLGSLLQLGGFLLAFGMIACSGPFLLPVLS